jgi:hypothetical protein
VSERRAEREKGKAEGKSEGKIEGEGFALQRLLVKRFGVLPAELASRIECASQAEIEGWLDRALDARRLAEVFDLPGH